jgi:maltodextrin utilization protein YvdJ
LLYFVILGRHVVTTFFIAMMARSRKVSWRGTSEARDAATQFVVRAKRIISKILGRHIVTTFFIAMTARSRKVSLRGTSEARDVATQFVFHAKRIRVI